MRWLDGLPGVLETIESHSFSLPTLPTISI